MNNLNHIDEFFKTQTLILWRPGYMGGFLMNLLGTENPYYTYMCGKNQFGRMENMEWQHTDYFVNYFSYLPTEYNQIEALMSDIYGKESSKKNTAYLIAVIKHINESSLDKGNEKNIVCDILKNIKTKNDVDNLLRQLITKNYFNSVKTHDQWRVITDKNYHSIPWKEKIYCYFTPEKEWLTFVLHFYKLSYYRTVKSKLPYYDESHILETTADAIINNKELKLDGYKPEHNLYPNMRKEEFRHVDVYKLLFEDNGYTQLGIDITEKQKDLIDKARQDTINILDLFELPHTLNLENTTVISECEKFDKFRKLIKENYSQK